MKIILKILFVTGSSVFLLLALILYGVGGKAGFVGSYQSVIQLKYDHLMKTSSKKIILIGGSNLAFGINETMITDATGYDVANLGLHAGFGTLFPTELSKANINAGDIVVLAYEYGWEQANSFSTFGVDLIMSGIDNRLDMYRYVPVSKYPEILDYLPEYYSKKNTVDYLQQPEGSYTSKLFNDKGQMTYFRDHSQYAYTKDHDITLGDFNISGESKQYLSAFKSFVESKGASLYFTAPVVYKGSVIDTQHIIDKIPEKVEKELGIPYISKPSDYLFDLSIIYDSPYHTTSAGETLRTKQLIADLKTVINQ